VAILSPLAAVTNVVGVPGSDDEDDPPPHAYRPIVAIAINPILAMLFFEILLIAIPMD
jgi:hypothetical protein